VSLFHYLINGIVKNMATVITNMLSAIPWIGQDFVQFQTLTQALLPIGILSPNRFQKPRTKDQLDAFLSLPQSLLAFFVGLCDGDGYISSVSTTKGFINIQLVINLTIDDAPMLQELQAQLNLGIVTLYPNLGTVKLVISRRDLQEVLFPLLIYHNMMFLTNIRRAQYNMAVFVMQNRLTRFASLPARAPELNMLPTTAVGYLNLEYFSNWVVGFTTAEGSFHVKASGEVAFSLTQRPHPILFEALKLLFNGSRSVTVTNNSIKIIFGSVTDVTSVVNFFSFSGHHPLIGLKEESYQRWLAHLRVTPRFNHIRLP
jgi:hypothetical protein